MKKWFSRFCFLLWVSGVWLASCEKLEPGSPADHDLLDGPVEGLTYSESRVFLAGDVAFNDEVFTTVTGLGPLFVATSCASCHAGDGKGHPFSTLTRFGQSAPGSNMFLGLGGPQLQHRALPGYDPEQIPPNASFSKFTPPANTGLGFLELVPDTAIIDMADPDDLDGDGISGIPHWITPPDFVPIFPDAVIKDGKYIHRFGKKAAAYSLLHQTVNAYSEDIGVASIFAPIDTFSGLEVDPEISTQTLNDVVFYLQTLKAPIPRNQDDPIIGLGRDVFEKVNCTGCHVATLKTGYSSVEGLSNTEFHPYTDLLLHDMGPGLDDGYTEGNAETYEWRTPPLWGLGLAHNSQGGQLFLMHDGRARSIEEAILIHGGEATRSRSAFEAVSPKEKEALIAFLNSL